MDPPESPSEPEPRARPESWSYLAVDQQPLPDRTNVERLENILSFVVGASFSAPVGVSLFVLMFHADHVAGLDWDVAASIFILACSIGGGWLLARVKPTLC